MYGRKKREAQTYQNFGSGGVGSTNFYGGNSNNWGYSYSDFPTPLNRFAFTGIPFFWYPNNFWSFNSYPWGSSSTSSTTSSSTSNSGATFSNFGSGGIGSTNYYGRKKREAQTYINHGTGGSGSTNYNYGSSYNNFGSGGAGSSNSNHYSGTIN